MKIRLQFPWKVDRDHDGEADDIFGDLWIEWILLWIAGILTLGLVMGVASALFAN